MAGSRPMLLSSTLREDNATLTCDLTNPDLFEDGRLVLEHDQLHIRRSTFLWQATCHERIMVRNFGEVPLIVPLELHFAADFADLFEVRGATRERRGMMHAPRPNGRGVVLGYTGLDGRWRATSLRFEPAPAALEGARARFMLDLPPGGRSVIHVDIACDDEAVARTPVSSYFFNLREARRRSGLLGAGGVGRDRQRHLQRGRAAQRRRPRHVADRHCRRGPIPMPAFPWFSAAFGRDAMITALLVLWMDPAIARGVLLHLAANQARKVDAARGRRAGQDLHEVRRGEMAELGEVPFRRYYGSVDSTPLFVMLAGAYLSARRPGDVAACCGRISWRRWPGSTPTATATATGSSNTPADQDRARQSGLEGQPRFGLPRRWHAGGGPIALVEVQGYAYAAPTAAPRGSPRAGEPDRAAALDDAGRGAARAASKRRSGARISATYALALDGAKRPCRVRSSNAGHLLLCGVPAPARAARSRQRSVASASFAAGGCAPWRRRGALQSDVVPQRLGLAARQRADRAGPGALRLSRRERPAHPAGAVRGRACTSICAGCPSCSAAFRAGAAQAPTSYPVACSPQAWAAAAPLGVAAGLPRPRLRSGHPRGEVRPAGAAGLSRTACTLRNLAVGAGRIDVVAQRVGCRRRGCSRCGGGRNPGGDGGSPTRVPAIRASRSCQPFVPTVRASPGGGRGWHVAVSRDS